MGKMEKLTNSLRNQTRKEVKGMKKVLISLGLAMVLVVAMTAPVMAAASEESETASVTVNAYISSTITDAGSAGINFGSLNPGTSDNPEAAQSVAGVLATGTATGADSATVLVDSAATFIADGVVAGDTVNNTTDSSSGTVGTVDSETQLTLTADLTGGTNNLFQSGDSYSVGGTHGAINITVGAETNAACKIGVKGSGDFSDGGTNSFALSNAEWDDDETVGEDHDMTTTYAQIGGDTTAGVETSQELYHWISVPNGQAAAAYTTTFWYKADTTL